MLTVWPDMPWRDVDAVLSTLRKDPRVIELVCKDAGGRIWSVIAGGGWPPGDLAQVTIGARQAAILEMTLDDRHPLMTGVLPDHDGVMRARWGNPPAPSDRRWAFLKTLRPGQAVTGTVTGISDRGVTSVGIGSVTAQIGPPAPGSPPAVPPPSASTSQPPSCKSTPSASSSRSRSAPSQRSPALTSTERPVRSHARQHPANEPATHKGGSWTRWAARPAPLAKTTLRGTGDLKQADEDHRIHRGPASAPGHATHAAPGGSLTGR